MKQHIYSARFQSGPVVTRQSTNVYPFAWRVTWVHPETGETVINDGFSPNREMAVKSANNHAPNKRRDAWMSDEQAAKKRMFYYRAAPTIKIEIVQTKREIPKSKHVQRIPKMVRL